MYLFVESNEGGDAQTSLFQVLDAFLGRVDRIDDDVIERTTRCRYGTVVFFIDGTEIAKAPEDASQRSFALLFHESIKDPTATRIG